MSFLKAEMSTSLHDAQQRPVINMMTYILFNFIAKNRLKIGRYLFNYTAAKIKGCRG